MSNERRGARRRGRADATQGLLSVGDSVQKDDESVRRLGNAPVARSTHFRQPARTRTALAFRDLSLETGIKERAVGVTLAATAVQLLKSRFSPA